jgi:hypothetical protein
MLMRLSHGEIVSTTFRSSDFTWSMCGKLFLARIKSLLVHHKTVQFLSKPDSS